MKLHADLSQRIAIDTNVLLWIDSPTPGVQRRMLDRDGEEVTRATSIIRYAPGSAFPSHTHGDRTEFLGLDGVFSDRLGRSVCIGMLRYSSLTQGTHKYGAFPKICRRRG